MSGKSLQDNEKSQNLLRKCCLKNIEQNGAFRCAISYPLRKENTFIILNTLGSLEKRSKRKCYDGFDSWIMVILQTGVRYTGTPGGNFNRRMTGVCHLMSEIATLKFINFRENDTPKFTGH